MSGQYDDIMDLPHHVSNNRPKMALEERAKQFSPFAALKGYDEAIARKQRIKEDEVLLTDYSKALLDEKLKTLAKGIQTDIEYFDRDERVSRRIQGKLTRISPQTMSLQIDGISIAFEDIIEIR
ncbi:MAG: hypothetical protein IJ831_01375 [Spirochaetales bacterium]|nr:hypothetical protein [Spirochaetales bacterium]